MRKNMFTDRERDLLSQNPYIKNPSEKGITSTNEFKRIFIAEHAKDKLHYFNFENPLLDSK